MTEALTRQVVGDMPIDDVLTVGKADIQTKVRAKIQELADRYRFGLQIISLQLGEVQPPDSVASAFKEVASAKEDRAKLVNEALGYQNEKIPDAEGRAAQLVKAAEGYKAERITKAEGDVRRFAALVAEYAKAPDITRERLYQETMQKVLRDCKKTIVDPEVNLLLHSPITHPGKDQ
jgi:membrane protease subunit HflK